jgi:hypothetical protein
MDVALAAKGSCTIDADRVTLTGVGPCTITASQPGIRDHERADDVVRTFMVLAPQTIAFDPLPDRVVGDPPFDVAASASSGLPVSYSARGNCVIRDSTVTLEGAGSCAITAMQGGNERFAPAEHMSLDFTIRRASQTVSIEDISGLVFGSPPVDVAATASSGLPVGHSADGPCEVEDLTVRVTGAGTCVLTGSQPGNADNLPAANEVRAVQIGRAPQEIIFDAMHDVQLGTGPFVIEAATTSGLSTTFIAEGACSVDGDVVSLDGPGRCSMTARQEGSDDFEAALDVTRSFTIIGPITRRRNLTGRLAAEPPGTLVGSGARITSALEPDGRADVYAVRLEPGQELTIRAAFDAHGDNCDYCQGVTVATPSEVAAWQEEPWTGVDVRDDAVTDEGASWIATEAGIHVVWVHHWHSGGPVYPYRVGFDIGT